MIILNIPVNGRFSEWSTWSSCSATCGFKSYKMRNRTCLRPAAGSCSEGLEEKIKCDVKPCVDFVIAGAIGGETVLPKHAPPNKGTKIMKSSKNYFSVF